MGETSIIDIITALEGMKQELVDCCRILNGLMVEMRDDITHLRTGGFPVEKEEEYVANYYNSAKGTVESVVEHIYFSQINELDRVIDIYKGILYY